MAKTELSPARGLRLIAHGPVTLITTEVRGLPNIAACSWITPAATNPPTVALAVAAGSRTRANLDDSAACVVNIPSRALARETHYCGVVSGRDTRKERDTGLPLEPAGKVAAPLISSCPAHLECVVREAHPVGGHVLYLAEVVLAVVDAVLFDEAWNTDDERARTLHHLGGDFYTSPGPRIVVDPRRPVVWTR